MPRTPLLHPGAFFDERAPTLDVGRALVLGLLLALVTTAGAGLVGWAFVDALDVTVSVDNPAHTPDWVCEQQAEAFTDMSTPSGCGDDVPETVERDLGELVWDEFVGLLPWVLLGALLAGLGTAVTFHVLTALAGGEGSFGDTLAVTAWGATPLVVQTVAGGGYTVFRIQRLALPNQPEAAVERLATLTTFGNRLPLVVLALVVTAWQVTIWTHGLRHARNVGFDAALAGAGLVGAVSFLLTLVG